MTRLLILVEGQTEESFVNEILAPHLYPHGYHAVSARLIGNARQRHRRGGIQGWHVLRSDILRHLKNDKSVMTTLMVDYYALPQTGQGAWPERSAATTKPHAEKAPSIESALRNDISQRMGDSFNPHRFVPFIVMHEFEGLLFSDCHAFSRGIYQANLADSLQEIRNQFDSPEEINDSTHTAPSKRVEALFPNYEKPLHGTLAALEIGLASIRRECPHFAEWLTRLENTPRLNER